MAVGTAADEFLVPSLEVISKTLKLTQNVAGVTFLALGNGAADVFGAYAALSGDTANLAIGQIVGMSQAHAAMRPDRADPHAPRAAPHRPPRVRVAHARAGSGTFVVCIVVAIIGFSHTFKVTRRPFIRDIVMYIGAVSYLLGMLVRPPTNASGTAVFGPERRFSRVAPRPASERSRIMPHRGRWTAGSRLASRSGSSAGTSSTCSLSCWGASIVST